MEKNETVPKLRFRRKLTVGRAVKYIYLFANIFFMLFPLYFMFLSAFKTDPQINNSPFAWPKGFGAFLANIKEVWTGQISFTQLTPFPTMLGNTLFLTVFSLLLMLICATLCSYALGRLNFRGKGFVVTLILFVQAVPFFGYLTPMYVLMDKMGFTNSLPGIVPVYTAVSLPSATILMLGFFKSFPKSVEEAAIIDGCSEFKKFVHIVLPMSMSIVGSMAVVNFMAYWNEIAIANLLLQENRLFTINMNVFMLTDSQLGNKPKKDYVMTLLTLSAVPNLIFFTVLQKSIIKGISVGSVKG